MYLLALDQGTTSCRAIIFDADCRIVAVSQKEFTQFFPQPGWVEHDAEEIWAVQRSVTLEVVEKAGLKAADIGAMGITNQRETTVLWDRKTGKPVAPAIVWQDRRTAAHCEELRREGAAQRIQQSTGLVIDAYFSATKLAWLLDHVPGARARAEAGELAFGTIDTWLIWNLTGGQVHATDASNASRTMLYNIHKGQWDEELLALFRIPASVLPEVRDSSGHFGTTSLLGAEVAIAGVAGDQQAALFGQACISPGMVKNTYGTGCFMLMQTGSRPVPSTRQLLTTVAWQIKGQLSYALEGSVFIAGALVQWLRDGLGIVSSASEIEALAAQVPDAGGVQIVPAFSGLGAPYWDPHARGIITGLTRGTTRAHIARAALEAIALQNVDLLTAMQGDSGITFTEIRVDGGATRNDLLMQLQADLAHVPVIRPQVTETTALGAACLAGLAVGRWDKLEAIGASWAAEAAFHPQMAADVRHTHLASWRRAVAQCRAGTAS